MVAFPTGPDYSGHLGGMTAMKIMTVQTALTAFLEPPATQLEPCTAVRVKEVVVAVLGTKLHSEMLRQ